MNDFDFKAAKRQIGEILAIVESCPEPLREKCFELLFSAVFAGAEKVKPHKSGSEASSDSATDDKPSSSGQQREAAERKLPSNILSFIRRYEVSLPQLQKLFLLDHDPLLPIYKIDTKVNATAQLQKVMMILLENGLLNNQLKAPYTELRDSVKEAGLMDGNFNSTLKKNHLLFKGAITKDKTVESGTVELTGDGMQRLADIVKELAAPTA